MSNVQPPDIERILYTEEQIRERIREVAGEISAKYKGRDLKLIGVLKGSVFFLTALAKEIEIPVKIDFLAISSFSNNTGELTRPCPQANLPGRTSHCCRP